MSERSADEDRRLPRVTRHFMVRFRSSGEEQGGWMVSSLRDLSSGGARFLSEESFDVGTTLELHLVLPGAQEPVALKARVAWVKPTRMNMVELGVTFDPGDAAIQRTIDAAVAHFLRKSPGRR